MNNRRIAVAGLGIFAAASLSLTACESTTTPTSASSSSASAPTVAPAGALAAALGKLKGQGYDVTVTGGSDGLSGSGSVDPTTSSAAVDEKGTVAGQSIEIAATQIGTNLWAKVNLGAAGSTIGIDPTKWLLVDQTKLSGPESKPFDLSGSDAFDLGGVLTSVTNVTATDPTHLTGTVDLTAATGISAPASDALSKAGAIAKATPFTATLDDQGRLTDLKVNATSADLSEEFAFSNYGTPTAITAPPAADVVPAPAAIYQVFNG